MANDTEKNVEIKNVPGEAAEKPKKKKPIIVVRPQNSKTGFVKAGQRPGTEKKAPARPAGARPAGARPAAPGTRPAPGSVRRPAGAAARPIAAAHTPEEADAVKARKAEEAVQAAAAAKVTEAAAAEVKAVTGPAENTAPAAGNTVNAEDAAAEQRKTAAAAPADVTKPETDAAGQKAPETPSADTPSSASAEQKKEEPAEPAAAGEERTQAVSAVRPAQPKETGAGSASRTAAAGTGTSRPQARTARPAGSDGASVRREGVPRRDDSRRDTERRPAQSRTQGGAGRPAAADRRPAAGQGRGPAGRDARPADARGGARGASAAPGRGPAGRNAGGRGAAPMDSKPFEKESRKNDRSGKKNVKAEHGDKFDRRERSQAQAKGGRPKPGAKSGKPAPKPVPKVEEKIKSIIIPETLTIKDLADKLKIAPAQIVKKLFMQGKMVTVNEEIEYDTAEEIALEYEVLCEKEVKVDVIAELLKDEEDSPETLQERPPVVCVMGHVDHGKTSLLDAIRNTHVIDREAGGITQHIGASVVNLDGRKITFLDTPGHEAFTSMRMRGANSTDIAILVVAADDGVMPQTVEAINHAKAAGIEIIVAINKIDKPGANVDKVKQELTEYELIPEDWGGSTVFAEVSAKTHEGIDNLLEMVLLTAEVLELKANPDRRARGLVIEARLDKGRGPVASILIQKGTLHVGDPICAGSCYGRVRAMLDDKGRAVKEAGPSTPVEIQGFSDVPGAGEIMVSPATEKEARSFAETFIADSKEKLIEETKHKMSLDDLFTQIQAGNLKELNLIVKADVQGSVEAVKQSLLKLSNEEIIVKIIHSGAGNINESDVILASASNAIIIGFNVDLAAAAKSTAEQEGVDVRLYRVIYDAIDDVERAMKGMLDPIFEEKILGHAQVRQTFRASGVGTIAGSYVVDGVFTRGCKARITRGGKEIFDGSVASLKRFKDDVKEVKAGYECGLVFEKFNDIAVDDEIEAYTMVEVPR